MISLGQYFRCPIEPSFSFELTSQLSEDEGYFSFGQGTICFGKTSLGVRSRKAHTSLYDMSQHVEFERTRVLLPIDPSEIIANLSLERYVGNGKYSARKFINSVIRHSYYALRPFFPLGFRSYLQQLYLRGWQNIPFPNWPVDVTIDDLMRKLLVLQMKAAGIKRMPFIWFWPDGAKASCVMTHDVEEELGKRFCSTLMDLNDEFNIPASFQVVPEKRYEVTQDFLNRIKKRGFEVNVQDLNHDGRLYWDYDEFKRRAAKINRYRKEFEAKGFRAGILYRKQEWFDQLNFEYDMSVPNVAHLDPQRGGCCTVMPYFIGNMIELPVTTSQDHTVFHILQDYSLNLWREQISTIIKYNGFVSFIIHPDYIIEDRAMQVYRDLLSELNRLRAEEDVWIALPGEVNTWWRDRNAMRLKLRNGDWVIEGPRKERARIAFAVLDKDELVFDVSSVTGS